MHPSQQLVAAGTAITVVVVATGVVDEEEEEEDAVPTTRPFGQSEDRISQFAVLCDRRPRSEIVRRKEPGRNAHSCEALARSGTWVGVGD